MIKSTVSPQKQGFGVGGNVFFFFLNGTNRKQKDYKNKQKYINIQNKHNGSNVPVGR